MTDRDQGTAPDDTAPDSTTPDDTSTAAQGVGSPEKDPSDWVTGDEPPTGPQTSYLSTLAREADVEVPEDLTKAQASEMIDDLQSRTGRGQ
ncbi:DUF3072 domain-containing protein [uncultured Cellulomonas sp.]|uniref:DUF3072 domain-containing protein n=1 Tax=uncultured Cellulomonas sp. TaxID=189682 RepID=UPI00261DB56C|nr:DUF3072 domain-containing protein [uncultured Cellulomonas sp.]